MDNIVNKKSPSLFKEAVLAEAKVMKRKEELYEQVMAIEKELRSLSESGFVGTFGFKGEGDRSTGTTTGFESTPDISHVSELMKEFGEGEANTLEEENIALKNKIEELEKQLSEIKK